MGQDPHQHHDLDPLILDLLEWIAREPRTYAEVIEAWRTSCPRLTVWEDCIDRGLATRARLPGREMAVQLTDTGRDFLHQHRERAVHSPPQVVPASGPAIAGRDT